jgi:hypothetical protein
MTKEQFIGTYSFWDSYKPLLWEALQHTTGDVVELGMGDGSTEKLHDYCKNDGRLLYSYESNLEWYRKFEKHRTYRHTLEYVGNNWEVLLERHREPIGVLFSDEAPGEMRKYNISMFATLAKVIVAHDAEPSNDHAYRFSWVKCLFKYHKLHEFPGASTIVFSNFIDVSKWSV